MMCLATREMWSLELSLMTKMSKSICESMHQPGKFSFGHIQAHFFRKHGICILISQSLELVILDWLWQIYDSYGHDVEVDFRGTEVTVASFLRLLTGTHTQTISCWKLEWTAFPRCVHINASFWFAPTLKNAFLDESFFELVVAHSFINTKRYFA